VILFWPERQEALFRGTLAPAFRASLSAISNGLLAAFDLATTARLKVALLVLLHDLVNFSLPCRV
jgi:hypothetical protein